MSLIFILAPFLETLSPVNSFLSYLAIAYQANSNKTNSLTTINFPTLSNICHTMIICMECPAFITQRGRE
jgi:hypothetical protein